MAQTTPLKAPAGAGYAVIFTAKVITYDDEYYQATKRLRKEVQHVDGFIAINSVCSDDGLEISVSYWKDLESIRQWGQNDVHRQVMKDYRKWYSDFHMEICEILSGK